VWTDLIQGLALLAGGILVMMLGFAAVGGPGVFFAENDDKLHMVLPADRPTLPWTIFLLGIWIPNLAYWGLNQFITQRAYSAVAVWSDVKPADRVAVLGPGPIGILCGAIARLRGAEVALVGLEQDEPRLETAAAYGCARFRSASEPLRAWARERDGAGCDGVVDASGHSAALREAMELVRPAGFITKVGWGPQPLDCSLDPLVQKAVRLQGSFSHNWPVWERVIALMAASALDVSPLVGGVFPLREWKRAFEQMESRRILKAVLRPREI
jgi:alcohol dehydrogenase/L-iditol 2-dehydrogenase